jgi:HrpA-like RNA helicase
MKNTTKINLKNHQTPNTTNQLELMDLPVLAYEKDIKELIQNNTVAIIIGATGSGKTTEIGRMMSDIINGKIATTQPRRPAAVTVATYVAQKLGEEVGETVGYHVRFNDTTNKGTTLDYVTDGILIEQLLTSQTLPEYSGIILDEAHIRNLNIDFLMGLILRVNDKRRQLGVHELKVLITSATIPADKFSEFFGKAPILEIPGKMYPVTVYYDKTKPKNYIEAIGQKLKKALKEGQEGDVLIFVPGEAEIRKTINYIKNLDLENLEYLPFYGQQSLLEQEKVFASYPRRKIVVATNIAETSLTINGIRIVIDVGLQRSSIYDHKTGIARLEDEDASWAAIDQRKGRAGRVAPGICYRLYPEKTQRPQYDIPEILKTDLAGTVLKMKRLGIEDILNFKFIDQPKPANLRKAIHNLKILGALDDNENITGIGRIMANLPLDPHISRMVIEANKFGCVEDICTIAAFMSSKSVFLRPQTELSKSEAAHRYFKLDNRGKPLSDQESFLKVWKEYLRNIQNLNWCQDNYLNLKVLQEVTLIKNDLTTTLRHHRIDPTITKDPIHVAKSIAAGTIGNLLERVNWEEYRRMYGSGDGITIHPSSSLKLGELPQYIVAGEIMINAAGYTGAFQCQPVDLNWIPEVGSQILRETILGVQYNPKKDEVQETVRYNLKNDGRLITTIQKPLKEMDKSAASFADYIANLIQSNSKYLDEFDFIKDIKKIRQQIQNFHIRSNGQTAELTSKELAQKLTQNFLEFSIISKKSLKEAIIKDKIDLSFSLEEFISPEKQAKILSVNPDQIDFKNKSYPIIYHKNKKNFQAQIQIPFKDFLEFEDLPNLPSWSPKNTYINLTGTVIKHPILSLNQFNFLQELATEEFLLELWDKSKKEGIIPQEQVVEIDSNTRLDQILASIPAPIIYAKYPEIAEELVATPALTFDKRNKKYKIRYFSSKREAKKSQEKAIQKWQQTWGVGLEAIENS